nr:hypothetical protein [Tanacetum cinerariifolium]
NAKPFEIAFLEFVELVIISTYSDPIRMLVVMPFDDLKLCDSDDSTFGVDISSRFPIDCKFIKLLTFVPLMYNATPPRIRLLQERIQALLDSWMILSSARRTRFVLVLNLPNEQSETSDDAERPLQQVDHQLHLSQIPEVWVLPNLG